MEKEFKFHLAQWAKTQLLRRSWTTTARPETGSQPIQSATRLALTLAEHCGADQWAKCACTRQERH
jgi:hypothetical protein